MKTQKAALALCRACEINASKNATINTFESFDSIELDAEFRRLGLDSFHTRAEDAPPNKRRRVREMDLLDEVTANLYSLLGSQEVTDLDGLSQVAE